MLYCALIVYKSLYFFFGVQDAPEPIWLVQKIAVRGIVWIAGLILTWIGIVVTNLTSQV